VNVEVLRTEGTYDVISYDPTQSRRDIPYLEEETRAAFAFNSFDRMHKLLRGFETATTEGKVSAILPLRSGITAEISLLGPRDFDALPGAVCHFRNSMRRTAHTIQSVRKEGDQYTMQLTDDILVGLAKIDAIEPQAIVTSTPLPLAPTYRGTTLYDEIFSLSVPVKSVANGRIELAQPLPADQKLKVGDKVWLSDIGVGDTIEVPQHKFKDMTRRDQ
jgi:hypothetical protein